MNPSDLCQNIKDRLIRYMQDRRPIQKKLGADHPFAGELDEQLKNYEFIKDAYVERIPHYRKDAASTLAALRDDGVLEVETTELFTRVFGCGKPEQAKLYSHQGKAIRAVVQEHKNLVVCTGTGSGKTESFLIPVLNAIIAERKREQGHYEPGVRALILYPMNALVNDQLRRLREILRHAQSGETIPYAREITFGCYTSELDRHVHRRAVGIDAAPQVETSKVRNPRYSEDAKLGTEYIARSQWNAPADILITNYAMLERLLIDPDKDSLFSSSWKFIVLDEAHSYDGSLGTDISWLVRRLAHRTGAQDMRYIATSATLTDKEDPEEAKEDVRRNFASRLFPAPAESFSVEMGDRKEEHWDTPTGEEAHYADIVSKQTITLPGDLFREMTGLPKAIRPEAGSPVFNLLELTQWQKESAVWLKQFSELQHAGDSPQALGDLLRQARLYNLLDPDGRLGLEEQTGAFSQLAGILEECKKKIRKYLPENMYRDDMSAEDLENDILTLHDLPAPLFASVGQTLSDEFAGRDENPMCLAVAWDAASQDAIRKQWDLLTTCRSVIQRTAGEISRAWALVLHAPEGTALEAAVTSYVKGFPHAERLACELQKKNSKMTGLAQAVFPGKCKEAAMKEFLAFAQLLTLTEDDGKPLMDLRFHILVKTISRFAVYFDDELKPHPVPDDEDAPDYNGHRLYTLGLCPVCGQPYLLGYHKSLDMNARIGDERRFLFKYKSNQDGHIYLHAFTFLLAPEEPGGQEEAPAGMWLKPETGEVVFGEDHTCEDGWVPLYHYSNPADKSFPEHIDTCPVCSARSSSARLGDEGLIIRYRTGEARAKTITLHAITQSADPSATAKNMQAQGRKVLSFSDSRAQAAKLASDFEKQTQVDLIEYAVYHAMEEAEKYPGGELALFLDTDAYCRENGVETAASHHYDRAEGRNLEEFRGVLNRHNVRFPDRYALSTLLKSMAVTFRQCEAWHLLSGCYPAVINGEQGEAPEAANVALAALSVLRQRNRNSLVKSGAVEVRSYTGERYIAGEEKDSKAWQRYTDAFSRLNAAGGGSAAEFFREVYAALFQRANLNCTLFDIRYGSSYQGETGGDDPVNGREPYERPGVSASDFDFGQTRIFTKMLQKATGLRNIKDTQTQRNITNTLNCLKRFMQETRILTEKRPHYLLNLEDVRFHARQQPESLAQAPKHFRIEEHTAQISSAKGSEYQRLFSEGAINILSCSTTFEMGVDLGSLNCVFMGNMPPGVANYQQRAGRAGRRAGAASCVITFIGNSSHDRFYSTCPEKLFFGGAKRPSIYVENPTFMAKHMRAEAFHHFLSYLSQRDRDSYKWWQRSQNFFGFHANNDEDDQDDQGEPDAGPQNIPAVAYLAEWYDSEKAALQSDCEAIAASVHAKLDYNVAADLCYQTIGTYRHPLARREITTDEYAQALDPNGTGTRRYLELDGPNMPPVPHADSAKNPLIVDYGRRSEGRRDGALSRLHMGSTIEELSSHRVLPKYGFPCDVIELLPHPDDIHKNDVRLSRERKLAIVEYAPSRKVYANKRVFESRRPLRFIRMGDQRVNYEVNPELTFLVCRCGYVSKMEGDAPAGGGDSCPLCKRPLRQALRKRAICPDGFLAAMSKDARYAKATWNRKRQCDRCYCGGLVEDASIPGTRLHIAKSATREILYFNSTSPFRDDGTDYDGLYHSSRTDMVIWHSPDLFAPQTDEWMGWDGDRYFYAWESAAQAIHKAISQQLDISPADIGVLLSGSRENPQIVIYDDSPSGSGVVLPLLHSGGNDTDVSTTSKLILQTALKIAQGQGGCTCYKVDERIPETLAEYLGHESDDDRENHRAYTACYHCLKSYSNQRMHPWLDAHDAAVVLRHLLGEAEAPEAQPDTVPAEVAPAPQVAVAVPGFVRKMRTGEIPPGELFRIRVEQGEIDAYFTDCNPDGSFTFAWEEGGGTICGEITADAIICQL